MSALGARPLVLSAYRRIAGSPIQSTYDLLHEFYALVPEARVEGIRVTGLAPGPSRKCSGSSSRTNSRRSRAPSALFTRRSARFSRSAAKAPKYIRLEGSNIVDYDRSGECAAGTGSFLDQQALRMEYSVEEVGKVV